MLVIYTQYWAYVHSTVRNMQFSGLMRTMWEMEGLYRSRERGVVSFRVQRLKKPPLSQKNCKSGRDVNANMSITPPSGGTTATGAQKHPHTHAFVLQSLFQAGRKGQNGSP